jgi:hypothetical protein
MYTDQMKMAFHSVPAPKNFTLSLVDNEHFISIKLNEVDFAHLTYDQKREALQYIVRVKDALEQNGAIVLVTRGVVGGR